MWHNLAEHAEKTVAAHRGCLKEEPTQPGHASDLPSGPEPAQAEPAATAAEAPPAEPDGVRDVCGRERRLVTRTRERHTAIHEQLAAGRTLGAISQALGLDRATVRRFAREPDVQ